jgi:hypothetical protein
MGPALFAITLEAMRSDIDEVQNPLLFISILNMMNLQVGISLRYHENKLLTCF